MRLRRLSFVLLVLILLLAVTSCQRVNLDDFIKTENGDFVLDGEIFKMAGTNNYYLNYKDDEMIGALIDDASEMGLNVIRCWAFLDGFVDSNVNNNAFMQTEAGVYDNIPEGARNGFEALDYALQKAAEKDIKLVLVLVNNWDAFGGIFQYVNWSETAQVHDDFYTDESCRQIYKDYFNYLANRKNTLTGVKYKDDPTIFAWELCNEPRCESDKSGETLFNWVKEMSKYVKSIDENHLVTVGDEGFFKMDEDDENWAYNGYSGIDWQRNLTIDSIDYGTFHIYPEHWGDQFANPIKDGSNWIIDHIKEADIVGKPVVLEEYGIQKYGQFNRDYIYETWTNLAVENGIDGTMFWILTSIDTGDSADEQGMYPDFDGFRIMNDTSRTTEILLNHAKLLQGEDVVLEPHVYITSPTDHEEVSGIYAIKAKSIENGFELQSYTLKIEGIDETFDVPSSGTLVLDTTQYSLFDEVVFTMEATYKDGKVSVDEVVAVVNNRQMKEVSHILFTFDDDLGGFKSKGIYQAGYGAEGITQSSDLGGTMKIDTVYTGDYDWMELKIINEQIEEMELCTRVEFDVFLVESLIETDGGTRHYLALDPGWIKVGQDENNMAISDMENVEIDGVAYVKQHLSIGIARPFDADALYICLVGNMITYKGPIYIDNVALVKKVFAD